MTLLFADIRGSTGIGERLSAHRVPRLPDRSIEMASSAVLDHDGLVDKLVGDEMIGLFFGGVTGPRHAEAGSRPHRRWSIAPGARTRRRAGRSSVAAVHTGIAYVGPTGPAGAVDDFTALGDAVNTTARWRPRRAAGELLVSVDAAEAAGTVPAGAERRTLELRGREATIDVVVLRPSG